MVDPEKTILISFDEHNVRGFVAPEFQKIAEIFRSNFETGFETAGASFAVFYKNNLIINLFGGFRNVEKKLSWEKDTTSVIFSTTKSISSVILAKTLDETNISYETRISTFWPEFAANGKEQITILDAVLHRAGLAYSEEILERSDIKDPVRISQFFENASPMSNGNEVVYHALTFGLLLDQIVRRIDLKKRGIAQILDEDFVEKYGISNLSIGLKNKKDNEQVAVLTNLDDDEVTRQGELQPEALENYMAGDNPHHYKLYNIFKWITTDDYNNLENRLLPMPSNMGISNAEGLAHFHSIVTNHEILSEKFQKLLEEPVIENGFDHAIGYEESKGYGFQYTKNPKGQWIFGHSGFGGQNVKMDVHNKLTFAYVSNGLKISDADMVIPWKKMVDEVYKLFDEL